MRQIGVKADHRHRGQEVRNSLRVTCKAGEMIRRPGGAGAGGSEQVASV